MPSKRTILALAVILTCWKPPLSVGALQRNHPPTEDALEEGIKLTGEGLFDEAVEAFTRFKQTAPLDSRPYFYSGMAFAKAGKLSAAALELTEAVRLSPERAEYVVLRANVQARLKQKVRALEQLENLEQRGLSKQLDPAWLKLLADTYFRLSKTDEARKILDSLSERIPDDADVDLNRGQIDIALGRSDAALDSFRKSIEKSSHNPIAHFELGKILYQRNELEEARKALGEAVRQDATNPEYLQKLADACLALGDVDEALGYLKRAEASAAVFPQIYYALGRAYQKKGDPARSDEYMKKFQEATAAERVREERDRETDRLISEGETLMDQGKTGEARALFERAAQIDPDNWDAHGYLAEMFLASGDLELARERLVRMEQIEPDSVVGNYLMAQYWYRKKDFERARGYAEKARTRRPGNSELRDLLGNIYMALGQREKALLEFGAAVRLAPDRADFREDLRRAEGQKVETNQSSQR